MNRKRRSLTPYSTKKSLYGEHRFVSWFGTMASSRPPNSAVPRTRMKQKGSRMKPEVATVSLARGVFGGDRRARIQTGGEQSNPGEFPKMLTPCASVHWYHTRTWTWTYNSLDLLLNSFSSRPFALQIQTDIARISFFLFSQYNTQMFEYFFFIYEFYYLHQNLTDIVTQLVRHQKTIILPSIVYG